MLLDVHRIARQQAHDTGALDFQPFILAAGAQDAVMNLPFADLEVEVVQAGSIGRGLRGAGGYGGTDQEQKDSEHGTLALDAIERWHWVQRARSAGARKCH